MPRKFTGFTFEEHQEHGARLKLCNDALVSLAVRTANSYGKTSTASKLADRAKKALDALRCELDDRVCEENRSLPDAEVTGCYYGPETRRDSPCS